MYKGGKQCFLLWLFYSSGKKLVPTEQKVEWIPEQCGNRGKKEKETLY
jgi:hypothetical protein